MNTIGIHPVHRRLAELIEKAEHSGGLQRLNVSEQTEIVHCLKVNAKIVRTLDELKQLAFIAHLAEDMEWVQEICRKIDAIEVKML